MAQPAIQHSFHAGEWAPELNARVDLQKYHSAAALLRNFFVDYRGGASTCPGTKYVLQAFKSNKRVRLIPFVASFAVNYVLEFGDFYIRFYNNGAPVLESGLNITGVSGNTITVANSYAVGDWIFVSGVSGITNINGNFYIVSVAAAGSIQVTDLFGNAVTFTGTWTSGGTTQRVYTIASPYAAADLGSIKFAQSVNSMILCHNNYPPNQLTIVSANNWIIAPIQFGPTLAAPTGVAVVNAGGTGTNAYGYEVTAVDANGIESPASSQVNGTTGSTANASYTLTVSWTAVSGALSYNIYRTPVAAQTTAPPSGTQLGFIANTTAVSYIDSFYGDQPVITPDFSVTPPVVENPFQGGSVSSVTITTAGSYGGSTIPSAAFATAPTGGATATGIVYGSVIATGSITLSDGGFSVGELLTPTSSTLANTGLQLRVTAIGGGGVVTAVSIANRGAAAQGTSVASTPVFRDAANNQVTVAVTWGVTNIVITYGGAGYTSAPAVTFSAGTAAGTAVLAIVGNPAVVNFFDQRAVFANTPTAVNTLYFSQPGSFFNFNTSRPTQADDSITASLFGTFLNTVKSLVPMSQGLVVFSDKSAWLVTGGGVGAPINAIDILARQQAYNGASDLPPIVVNFDILYNQAKGGFIRDLTFNFYTQIYTGTDISVLSSHLFYGHTIIEWAYSEEPFKMVWAIRDDGIILLLTFLKEQEIVGWSHRDTTNGLFKSVCSVVETVTLSNGLTMNVDAVYTVVQRTINSQTVQYIERVAERIFPNGAQDAWCVDAGIQYVGSPATNFSGAQHLAGQTVTGLADGVVIPPFTMPAGGSFTLGVAASKVTIGLAFTAQLQTLRIDLGEPTAQGKRKKITAVTVRCKDALGLTIGKSFSSQVPMKDLVVGNVGTMSNTVVSDLVTDDARTLIDPSWDVPGQYCIQQAQPLPASILGVIPEIVVGDTPK